MKLLTWNIRHGGGTRLPRIIEEIAAYDADVIALTEYRAGPGKELRAALFERGWRHVETTGPTENENGIAVFSRTPLLRRSVCPAAPEYRVRWLDIDLPEYGFGIGVLHIMAAGSNKTHPLNIAKVLFWEAVLSAAQARLHEPFLLTGDWNTGAHRVDEKGKTYVCAEHFGKLSASGWTDMWRHHNPGMTEWTWYSTLRGGVRGNGFRLDHCFATPSLVPRVTSCRYSHAEREAGISDHSSLIVDVE
ncbi:MAG TPA: endonuclease/exonuclease/phosphatase family protein [Bryobacteraceae bacterium]|nr:endonuclease/exonuclease/phosphatase family protein [Candidatus Acidoferrales bacterium]HVN04075.1 endonuclease/exonuclease/phosphatase family protein [Bryobacteraceae bacterium]